MALDGFPFESRFIDINGQRLHYVDEGDGPVLLCVHGNPTWSFAWRNVIARLSRTHRVISIDHIGCGLSDKPQDYDYTLSRHIDNLSTFIRQLGLSDATLIAHDWGGAIGVGAAQETGSFCRLVLMNTAAFRSSRIPWRIAVCRWPVVGPFAVRRLNLFLRAAFVMAVSDRSRITGEVRRGYLTPYNNWRNRVAIQRFVEDIPMNEDHVSYARLERIERELDALRDLPCLLIWGERDWCFTPDFRREFERRLPDAESHPIATAGHFVFEDAPDEVIGRIETFLRDHPADVASTASR